MRERERFNWLLVNLILFTGEREREREREKCFYGDNILIKDALQSPIP